MAGLDESGLEPGGGIIAGLVGVMVPLHLVSMFSMFYCLYFVAKTLKTIVLQREVSFLDYAGAFFLIWFFPIGIWIDQPTIDKMVEY